MARPTSTLVFFALLGVVSLLVTPQTGSAQSSGLAFLGIGPDAQGMALGDAGVASSRGPFAVERNPAGLARGSGTSLGVTHHQWIADVSTYGLSGRFDAGSRGGLGLYLRATGTGGLDARDRPGPSDGTFDVQFVTAGAAIGRSFGPVSVGVAGKYLSERIFTVSATGYAADLGAMAEFVRGSVQLGAAVLNLGSMEELVDRPTELPTTVRFGGTVQPFRILSFEDGATLLDAEITAEYSVNTADETSHMHFGASASILETVRLRLGYLTNDALRSYSAGIGLKAGVFRVDYALLPFEEGFGGPGHVFSLIYDGD